MCVVVVVVVVVVAAAAAVVVLLWEKAGPLYTHIITIQLDS